MNDEERHDEILIGRCENQALELLKNYNFQDEGVKKAYKIMVRTL
jgi:hypothetical protein